MRFYTIILTSIIIVNATMLTVLKINLKKYPTSAHQPPHHFIISFAMGLIANFLNTLGIGSYAIITSMNSFLKQITIKFLPGTMIIGLTGVLETINSGIPLITNIWPQAKHFFGFKDSFKFDGLTLFLLFISSLIGGIFGAKIVSRWSGIKIKHYMGLGLGIVAIIMLFKNLPSSFPNSQTDWNDFLAGHFISIWKYFFENTQLNLTTLSGIPLLVACIGLIFISMVQNLGIGCYAPILALLSLLEMSPKSGLFAAYICSAISNNSSAITFIPTYQYDKKATIAFLISGIIAGPIAMIIVGNIPTIWLNRIVNVLLFYVSVSMLKSKLS